MAHRNLFAAHHKVDGRIPVSKKKFVVEPKVLVDQPKPVEEALAQLRLRVMEVFGELPHGRGTKVAQELGVDLSRLTAWKKGEELPLSYLPLLPKALGVNAAWLLTGEEPKKPRGPSLTLSREAAVELRDWANRFLPPPGGSETGNEDDG